MARRELIPERFPDFLNESEAESDRAFGIMMAALLDEILLRLIKKAMIDDAPREAFRIVSQFANRIELAFALGLLAKEEYDTLHTIRNVRNDFAHNIDVHYTFETPEIRSQVMNMSVAKVIETVYVQEQNPTEHTSSVLRYLGESQDKPREYFSNTVMLLVGLLEQRTKDTTRPPTPRFDVVSGTSADN